ncbi:MAG: 50S ribosomal protein L4 [uncultured bacterium]|nr:MAG: 50S ribosomal protein L4 [uncultured bacterium]OGT58574.1 MAG: 50S ribosomal protein L4 [Gammaproteobacteria bacterium RIFCSPHIGHO2_12_FULL_42_10]
MELHIIDTKKQLVLADSVFGCEFNESLIHQVVTAQLAHRRAGTKAQKTRSEVSGGGVKPWRQKGTGRARAGTIRSPLWRKGGKIFAAEPRDYHQKINKKMHRVALRSMLSELIRQDRLTVVDTFQIEAPKTKSLTKKLHDMQVTGPIYILIHNFDPDLYLASRNLPYVTICNVSAQPIDAVTLVKSEKVFATEAALKVLEDLLK